MMCEILEPCRVLRLGTSSKKIIIIKQTKNKKIKKRKKGKKRANKKRREQVRKKTGKRKRKISCLAEKPTCF